jgi:hypothetical protein
LTILTIEIWWRSPLCTLANFDYQHMPLYF